MSLFEVKPYDREVYEKELKDFLPQKILDVHTHVYLKEFFPPKPLAPGEVKRTVTWPSLVALDNSIEDLQETYRLMLPGKPDHWYADCVAESYFGELIKHGVKVYRYTPGFLHGKSIMVDRVAAFVGSVNMDYRSFELDYECGVMVYSAPMIESLLEDMDMIVDRSHLVTAEEWAKRSVLRRVFEPLLRLFAIWM